MKFLLSYYLEDQSGMEKTKVLVVDDEPGIRNIITAYLKSEGCDFRTAVNGEEAINLIRSYKPDVIVLDIMLPGIDGFEVLSQLRRESNAYVIMLSAKSEEVDKLVGLNIGADDYLTKPFSPRELIARIKAAMRRLDSRELQKNENKILSSNHIRIDMDSRRVWVDGKEVELTNLEFDLITNLANHPDMVLSRVQLLHNVWGYDYFGDQRVVDVHIGHLRQKIGPEFIETVRGAGYRFVDRE